MGVLHILFLNDLNFDSWTNKPPRSIFVSTPKNHNIHFNGYIFIYNNTNPFSLCTFLVFLLFSSLKTNLFKTHIWFSSNPYLILKKYACLLSNKKTISKIDFYAKISIT